MASLIAGQLTPIGDHAWRVLARNPGMMTGPGTNSYLFGKESLTVIDPGPEDQEHLQHCCRPRVPWETHRTDHRHPYPP